MAGYIKAHRELLTHRYFKNEKLFKVMMYCLFKATHTEHTALVGLQNIPLKKGQFVFGRKVASLELNMKESTVWKYIKYLESDKFICLNSNNKFTIVTVENWESYQVNDDEGNNKVTTKEQQSNTYKKGKKGKKIKEYSQDSYEYRLSKYLYDFLLKRNPDHKEPNLQVWASHIDLMIRMDNRNPKQIGEVIKWTQEDSFWCTNVLSTSKLRKQYDTILIKMGSAKKVKPKLNIVQSDLKEYKHESIN